MLLTSIDFFISGEAAKNHLKMKIEENYRLLEVTGHHILLEVTEICHEPFLLSPSENSLHRPPLRLEPDSSNWFNYPNYFKLLLQLQKFYFLPQVTTQCTNPSSSASPLVPFQKPHKALLKEDTLYRPPLNPFLESPRHA